MRSMAGLTVVAPADAASLAAARARRRRLAGADLLPHRPGPRARRLRGRTCAVFELGTAIVHRARRATSTIIATGIDGRTRRWRRPTGCGPTASTSA